MPANASSVVESIPEFSGLSARQYAQIENRNPRALSAFLVTREIPTHQTSAVDHAQAGLTSSAYTAIGTIGLAFATFIAVGVTIWLARRDRIHAAADLATERADADARLERQIKDTNWRERASDAWAVQVMLTLWGSNIEGLDSLGATVWNYGTRTIVRVRAAFMLTDRSLAFPERTDSLTRSSAPPATDRFLPFHQDMDSVRPSGVLPAGAGLRFSSPELPDERVRGGSVLVRWLDFAGHHWQHDQGTGEVRELAENETTHW
jgi:hypothetical protein